MKKERTKKNYWCSNKAMSEWKYFIFPIVYISIGPKQIWASRLGGNIWHNGTRRLLAKRNKISTGMLRYNFRIWVGENYK